MSKLVMGKDAALPDRCVKCNAPARGYRLTRKLYWHPPAWYLLICVGILFYAIAALIVRKQATVHIGLCSTHVQKRKTAILVTWGLVALSVVSFILIGVADTGAFGVLGALSLLAALIYGVVMVPVVTPHKIDESFVWLNGVDKGYLADLPQFYG